MSWLFTLREHYAYDSLSFERVKVTSKCECTVRDEAAEGIWEADFSGKIIDAKIEFQRKEKDTPGTKNLVERMNKELVRFYEEKVELRQLIDDVKKKKVFSRLSLATNYFSIAETCRKELFDLCKKFDTKVEAILGYDNEFKNVVESYSERDIMEKLELRVKAFLEKLIC